MFCFNEMLLFLKSQFSFPHALRCPRALLRLLNLIEPLSAPGDLVGAGFVFFLLKASAGLKGPLGHVPPKVFNLPFCFVFLKEYF